MEFKKSVKVIMGSITNRISLVLVFLWVISPFCAYFARILLHSYFIYLMNFASLIVFFLILALRIEYKFPRYLFFFFLYAVYTVLSDIYLVNDSLDFFYLYKNMILGTFFTLFIIENTHFPPNYMKLISNISIGIIVIAFVVLLIQQFVNSNFFLSDDAKEFINTSSFAETRFPSIYSWLGEVSLLGLCFFPVLGILIAERMKLQKRFITLFFIMGAIASFLSKSRFIMVNFMSLLFLIPLYQKVSFIKVAKFIFIVSSICILLYWGLNKVGFNVDRLVNERILEKPRGGVTKGAAGTRILAFEIFGKLFPQNPLLGKGNLHGGTVKDSRDQELLYELRGRSSQIHVGYLSLFYYYGIIGGILFIIMLFYVFQDFYKTAQITWMWGALFGIIQFLLTNFTGVYLHLFIMGVILCFVFNKYYRDITDFIVEDDNDK